MIYILYIYKYLYIFYKTNKIIYKLKLYFIFINYIIIIYMKLI